VNDSVIALLAPIVAVTVAFGLGIALVLLLRALGWLDVPEDTDGDTCGGTCRGTR
jgi:hypothetical protein